MYELSVLIPARNEMFLKNTIEDILKNKTADTEIIAVLDGAWADPPIEDHPDVTLVYLPESVGQRAATNIACKLSRAKYVMKLDAHCAFDKGFDTKLIAEMHDDWTVVPMMYNLHCFDWECKKCGNTWYQGPTPEFCCSDGSGKVQNEKCDSTEFERKMIWKPRKNRCTWSWYFDNSLKFQYSRSDLKPPRGKDAVETMSLLGACWMLTRERYWELNICDEDHGSWGQQGTEIGAKSILSGNKLMCIRSTWFAHMFRTQGGDFGFPYKISGRQVQKARNYSKELWIGNRFEKQIYPLSYMIKKFNPPTWSEEEIKKLKEKEFKSERSGIYEIKNSKNNKIYIGSAKNLNQRFNEHLRSLKGNYHDNDHLQKSFNKYGIDSFTFNILFFCEETKLLEIEQQFIDEYMENIGFDGMYNINKNAASGLGRKHTKESKKKMSEKQSGENNGFYGKKHTQESIEKMRESSKGQIAWNKGIPWTDEVKDKISESQKGKVFTEEHRKKLSENNARTWLGKNPFEGKEHPKGMLGKHHSEETKNKISDSSKKTLRERDDTGKFISTKDECPVEN